MRYLGLFLLTLFITQVSFAQTITGQKEAEIIYRQSLEETKINKQHFQEADKCRNLIRQNEYIEAEIICRRAISSSEKLPAGSVIERYAALKSMGVVLLEQRKAKEAIPYFEKSLEVAQSKLNETDAETAEVYYFLGLANHLSGKLEIAKDFYIKAKRIYRVAFENIGDDEIRSSYPKEIKSILEAHLTLVKNEGLHDEAVTIQKRLDNLKIEFPKFLKN